MLTFKDYVEKAKINQFVKSNNEIAQMLNINNSCITQFCKEKTFPSQETVLKLAALAGVKPEQALIDFNLWKTKDKPNAHRIWQKLAKMIQASSLILLVSSGLLVSICKANKYTPSSSELPVISRIYYATKCVVVKGGI